MLRMRTRRNISLVLFIGLLLTSAVVWSMMSGAAGMEDGIYTGTAEGFGGDLVVDVTISGGEITDVTVRPHQETPFIADSAIEELTGKIVQTQSANVEAVSGATYTSKALIAAVEEALNKASGVYADGVYAGSAKGFGGDVIVDVTISGGEITDVTVRPHQETPFIADAAIEELTAKIVETKSTDVEIVSGATYTSKAVIEAVNVALNGTGVVAEPEPVVSTFDITLDDGTYRGSAEGFGGELVLDVTIGGGKITEIVVVKSSETPFIADGAFKELFPAIIEAQGPVDAVSGATYTSKAVVEAVEKALTGEEVVKTAAASTPFVIEVGDGTHRGTAKGFGGDLVLDVTVSGGKITEIVVVKSEETPFIADGAFKVLLPGIVEAQGSVEAVSGATYTSKAVLEAVENALSVEEAAPVVAATYDIQVGDGTHRGTAKGFGGDLVLDVTVSGGKITEIAVVKSEETPFIADGAFEELFPAIIEAQGPVDAVSGATYTSKAVLEAVENALSVEEAAPVAAATYDIQVGDGTHRGTAKGFGGDLVLDVTVSGGKITEIVVVESEETPFIADGAFEALFPAIIEAQGPVDAFSGATVTSGAIMGALEDALTE